LGGKRGFSGHRCGRTSYDQIVPIGASALLSSEIVEDATLKIYPGASHGLTVTHKDRFNADLLEFIGAPER
jgi:non-heme chloroperoxidase